MSIRRGETVAHEISHLLDAMGSGDGGNRRFVRRGDHVDFFSVWGVRPAMSDEACEYQKCSIFRTTEWAIWDPNKKMLHLFDDGKGALAFFNNGMVVREDS